MLTTKNGLAIGQKYDTSVNAKLQVAGGANIPNGSSTEPYNSYQIGGEPVMRNTGDATIISGKRSIYLRPNGTTDATGQVLVDTNGNAWLNGKLTIGNITANTTDTWIPVIKNGEIQYTKRKFASSKTYTDWNNNQDFLPTMSFLSYWNGAYDSGNNSNLTYCYQGTIQAKPISLFDNPSGTTGTVTLSETAANFSYLEIFYRDKQGNYPGYNSVKVYSPNGKRVDTTIIQKESADTNISNVRINTRSLTISGTSITVDNYQVNYAPDGGKYRANEQYIVKVIGYK